MALDLTLTAISSKAGFIIEKAWQDFHYAVDLDKIYDTNSLRLQWQMAQAYDEPPDAQAALSDLIKDSEVVAGYYPDGKKEDYQFYSFTRGYETINYLLIQYLAWNGLADYTDNDRIFYNGQNIDFAKQHPHFSYITNTDTAAISALLNNIEFDQLLDHYDYDTLSETGVYKLTQPESLAALREEYQQLQEFYNRAQALDAFILVKIG